MRKVGMLAAFALAALVGWNWFTTGNLTLIPSSSVSATEERIAGLEHDLDQARVRYRQAGRGAGIVGVDTTADAEAARMQVAEVERGIASIRREPGLQPREQEKLAGLESALADFKREMGS